MQKNVDNKNESRSAISKVMEQLKKAVSDFLSASRAVKENGLEINTGSLTQDIHKLLEKEKAVLRNKIKEEEEHVTKLEKRYNSLRSGGEEGEPTEVFHGDLESKMSKAFILKRTAVAEEIKSDSKRPFLNKQESDFLQFIAQDTLDFCKQKAETQRKQLDNALKHQDKCYLTVNTNDQFQELHNFQVHSENDSIPFLFKEYISCWEERKKKSEFKITKLGKDVKDFIHSCIDLGWFLTINTKDYYFDWDKTSKDIKCLTPGKPVHTKDCDIRVFRPALKEGQQELLKGKSICVTCENKTEEKRTKVNASSIRGTSKNISNNRACTNSSEIKIEIHEDGSSKSMTELKELNPQRELCADASNIDKEIHQCGSLRSMQSSLKSNPTESPKNRGAETSRPAGKPQSLDF